MQLLVVVAIKDKKMKKNIIKVLGGALLLGIVIKKARDYYRDIEKIEKETKEKLDNLGISQEALESVDPYDPNEFIKTLFIGVSKNPNFDIDVINVTRDKFWINDVHVMTTQTEGRNIMKKFVMYFALPDFTDRGKDLPGLGTIKRTFDEALDQIHEKIIKDRNVWAKKELVGIVSYYKKENDGIILKVAELDPEVYESFKDGDKPGLSNFYRTYKEFEAKDDDASVKWLNDTDKFILEGYEDGGEVEMYNISLAYKVSYCIAGINNPGINWDQALMIMKYLVDNLEVNHKSKTEGDPDPLRYNNLVFHCLDENEIPDLYRFYELDKLGQVKEFGFGYKE